MRSPRSADDPSAKVLAGGTALLILIKQGVYPAECLVNIRKIPGLARDRVGRPRGAADRRARLASARSSGTRSCNERYPALAEACHVVANIRIRNLATIGGNLAHADYQSDPPTVLVALGRAGRADRPRRRPPGRRSSDFLLGVYTTLLEPDELVTAVVVPPATRPGGRAYLKFTTRSSEDRPAAGAAALVRLAGRQVEDVVLVLGAVTPTPTRLAEVEQLLRGRTPDAVLLAEAGALAERAIEPIDDLRGSAAYKRRVAGALMRARPAAPASRRGCPHDASSASTPRGSTARPR